jgi:hypothetical protein
VAMEIDIVSADGTTLVARRSGNGAEAVGCY